MLLHHLKIAWRNLRARKVYASINIIGLTVGIATTLLIFLVVSYELSYDDFQSRNSRIHRVVINTANKSNGEITNTNSSIPVPLPNAMRTDFPQMEKVAAVWNIGGAQMHIPIPGRPLEEEGRFKETDGLFFVEPALFDVFDYTWMAGNGSKLTAPNTAVLNETLANKYFGDWKKAIGQTIQMWSFRVPLQIVGVFKDLPANTDIEITMGASYQTFRNLNANWINNADWETIAWSSQCFVLLPNNSKKEQFESQLPAFVQKYFPQHETSKTVLALQPLNQLHLDEKYGSFKNDALTKKELWSLGLVGFFILFVACINFINLATAQSINRAKEIGVRKVLGSSRSRILKQFLNETALITVTSVIIAYLLAQLALPFISDLMHKPLSLNIDRHPLILLFLVVLGVTVNFLAGFYPGMVLSGFNPVEAIKSKVSARSVGGLSLRRALVVFQFVIAQFLIIGTIVVIQQMKFFRDQPMGFEKNGLALLELPSDSTDQLRYGYLKTEILKIPGMEAASFCMDAPASFGANMRKIYYDNNPVAADFNANLQFSDTSFISTFRIGIVAGRIPIASDTLRELIVNETMVQRLGLASAKDIIGKKIGLEDGNQYPVVGVMHDFHSKSLKEQVSPFMLGSNSHAYNFISLRMDPARMKATLAQVEKLFTSTYPTYIYDLNFLDERIARFYATEALASQLFQIAAFLAIFISCLGLYGLVSFMATQKIKEVGIRKVLGASVQNIVYLFSKEFTLLIGIAFLIAGPIGYFLMQHWLEGFHYHIKMGWIIFLSAIILSIVIAWITVGYKAVSAALANPVKSLRTE